jgi:ribulose-bisphosphate carboxylase large chain
VSIPPVTLKLSGERIQVTFRLTGDESEALAKANDICIEQTVEFPAQLIPSGDIREQIFGRIESFERRNDGAFQAAISFAVEITGHEIKQLINVLFGNISLKPGIRIERLDFPEEFLGSFRGPRFGIEGLRKIVGAPNRPLLCTALKPLGLSAEELALQAYQFALGGIDIVKDDHSLADQPFAPFDRRVTLCAEAVAKGNRESGNRCLYMPSLTARPDRVIASALFAKEQGAGGLLMAPGIIGFDAMHLVSDDDQVGLPILSHPAFQGSLVTSPESGISHGIIFGKLARLAGADGSIFPNYGGRFSFTRDECLDIADNCRMLFGNVCEIFPTPGGGMTLDRIDEMKSTYGGDVIFLIGGALHQGPGDLVRSSRMFRELVEAD